jgi:hypothetical protein
MNIIRKIVTAGVAALALGGMAATTAATASVTITTRPVASQASKTTVDYVAGGFRYPRIRPHGITAYFSGDGSLYLTTSSWNGGWGRAAAYGAGWLHWRICWGSCHRYKSAFAYEALYRIRTHNRQPYFTRLKVTYTIHGQTHSVIQRYSGGVDIGWDNPYPQHWPGIN